MLLEPNVASSLAGAIASVVLAAVAGGWALYQYLRRRPLQESLKVDVELEAHRAAGVMDVSVYVRAENVGLVGVVLDSGKSSVSLLAQEVRAEAPAEPVRRGWVEVGSWTILGRDRPVAPGSAEEIPLFLHVPDGGWLSLRAEFAGVSRRRRPWPRGSRALRLEDATSPSEVEPGRSRADNADEPEGRQNP